MTDRAIFIALDAKGYSGTIASEHSHLQRDLREVLTGAASDAHLPYDRWNDQPQGDGVLILAPLDDEPRYVDDLIDHLVAHLRRRNRDRVPDGRLRLRVALDQGPATAAANGFAGEPPILACRLRDACVTKDALTDSDADLVLALSDQFYIDNVRSDQARITPDQFVRVEIDEEKAQAIAWIWLPPGHSSQTLAQARGQHGKLARQSGPAAVQIGTLTQKAEKIFNTHGDNTSITVN